MASKLNPEVELEIGGKKRALRLDLNAMTLFEDTVGKSITEINIGSMGARELRALLWVCMLEGEPELTLKEVGSWINMGNMGKVAGMVAEAFIAAMPAAEPDEDQEEEALPLVEAGPSIG